MFSTPSRRPLGWSSLLLLSHLLATIPRSASALEPEGGGDAAAVAVAETKAAEAFQAYQEKRFAESVALYLEAYQAAPNADILYNVARIYDAKLGDRPLAINFYRRYITDPGAVADRIQLANERLLTLREAELAATPAPEHATPAPTAADARASAASPEPEPGWSTPEVMGVLMGTAGIIALGVGAGFGVAAMSETKTVRELCEGNLCSERRGIDAAESANQHANYSTIGFAAGGALLAFGAAFYFWLGDESPETPEQASRPSLHLGVNDTRGGFGLELGGSW
jgi:tetratricopeptide (TPR) repeat protein